MDSVPGTSLYPLQRCKILHLVRHAQAIHNLEAARHSKTSPEYFDAKLSALGWKQVEDLRRHVHESGILQNIELVIVSPLLRTMQTAAWVFGGDRCTDGNVAESSINSPPFLAVELCRERLGVNMADKRRSVSEYKNLFPAIDFSLLISDEDTLWTPEVRESDEDLAARGLKFLTWLWTRKEKEIAVVTHSAFLFHTLSAFGKDCHPLVKDEISKFFSNCELRSMVLVDKNGGFQS